jgi:hypothetical protein
VALPVVLAVVNGDGETVLDLIRPVFVAATVLGFGYWMTKNARKTTKELRRQRRQTNTRRDADKNDVTGMLDRSPWMG